MKMIKRVLLISVLLVFCSMAVFAQSDKGDKKTPKKPNPPVVIVNLDKKSDKDKSKEKDKKKTPGFIIGFLRKL